MTKKTTETKTENSTSLEKQEKPQTSLSNQDDANEALQVIREQTERTLSEYDEQRADLAEKLGETKPESLSEVWMQACRQQDTNEMLKNNLMQMQVLFQELYQGLFSGINGADRQMADLIKKLEKDDSIKNWNRIAELRTSIAKDRSEQIKRVESMMKTMKQVASEYRQGEMAKAQFYHISEVMSQQMFVIAILKQMISDNTLMNDISDALFAGFQQMGSISKGDADG